jgi:hypothetical protein
MAIPSISNIEITDTFQVWLNTTNQLVDVARNNAMTASLSGDSTTGNSTLIGTFTANTVIAFDLLRTDAFSSKTGGSTPIGFSSPASINTGAIQNSLALTSTLGPRISYNSGVTTWNIGFENTTTNSFIISTSTALTPTVRITTAGEIIATKFTGAFDGTAATADRLAAARSIGMTGDVSWNITAFDGSTNVTASATISNNAVSNAKFRQSAGLSVVGNSSSSTANVSDITATSDGQVLRRSGTALGFGPIDLSNPAATTGVLPSSRGGTGGGSGGFTAGQILFGGTEGISSSSLLTWDNVNGRVGVNTPTPLDRIHVTGNVRATLFIGTATSAQYADLAEKFLPEIEYEPGTVVSVGGSKEIIASSEGDVAIGVISTEPALMMNSELVGGQYVALKGRVPVKTVDDIQKGDKLVPGNNGYAIKGSDRSLNVFGIALTNSENGYVEAVIL